MLISLTLNVVPVAGFTANSIQRVDTSSISPAGHASPSMIFRCTFRVASKPVPSGHVVLAFGLEYLCNFISLYVSPTGFTGPSAVQLSSFSNLQYADVGTPSASSTHFPFTGTSIVLSPLVTVTVSFTSPAATKSYFTFTLPITVPSL